MTKKSLIAIASIASLLTISGLSPSSAANKATTFCVNKKTFAIRMTSKCLKTEIKKTIYTSVTLIEAVPTQGVKGETGSSGPSGFKGDIGLTGPQGPVGPQGPQGVAGNYAVGANGAQGPAGPTGPAGAKGDTGLTGSQGTAGAKGDTGLTGSQGTAGAKGDTGLTGSQGTAGAKGDTGLTGPQGTAGAKGDTGLTGAQGTAGSSGFGISIDGSSALSLVSGKRYFIVWKVTAAAPNFGSQGFCTLFDTQNPIPGSTPQPIAISGGYYFSATENYVVGSTLYTASSNIVTFSPKCTTYANGAGDSNTATTSNFSIELVPFN